MKDVSKAIRKNEQGMVVLAGNVSPIDIYSHIPAICEEKGLPYIYTPSKEQLGLAVCLSTHSQLEAYPRVLAHTRQVLRNSPVGSIFCFPLSRESTAGEISFELGLTIHNNFVQVGRRRPVMIMLIKPTDDTRSLYEEVHSAIENIPIA